MSARDEIGEQLYFAMADPRRTDALLDAYRAEVLREAADALEARVADDDVDTKRTWAGMDAAYLRRLADKAATS
jgi:hypothetical protein